jgi:hypothetical protein
LTFQPIQGENPYSQPPIPEGEKSRQLHELRASIREAKNQLEAEEDLGRLVDQDAPLEFLALYGQKFTVGDFTLKFAANMMQSSTSLGNYKGYMDKEMKYEGGQYCSQFRKSRSVMVRLTCGNETKLLNVGDTGNCQFVAKCATPAVCNRDDIEALETLTVPELRKLVADL